MKFCGGNLKNRKLEANFACVAGTRGFIEKGDTGFDPGHQIGSETS